jgi:hypothetical protein
LGGREWSFKIAKGMKGEGSKGKGKEKGVEGGTREENVGRLTVGREWKKNIKEWKRWNG